MIESKAVLAGLYILLVLGALLLPYGIMAAGVRMRPQLLDRALLWSLTGVIVLFLLPFGSASRLIISVLLSLPFAFFIASSRGARLWGSILGFAIFSTVVWWSMTTEFVLWRIVPFWCLGGLGIWMLCQEAPMSPKVTHWALAIVLIVGLAAHLFVAPLLSPVGLGTAWHHWGVYVTAAQLLRAGAVPYVDFPLQYGFGPMVSMAVACRPDCWQGAYYVVSLANVAYLMVFTWGAGRLMANGPRGMALLAMAGVAAAVLLWTVYPPNMMGPLGTPSTSGLRFLPLAAILTLILSAEVKGRRAGRFGYALWSISMIWSPEAAIFASMVWWPYLALVDAQRQSSRSLQRIALTVAGWVPIMFGATLALALMFGLVFWVVFGQAPDLNGYLVYILNPPGSLPANLTGSVWVLLAVLALAGVSMLRANDDQTRILAASMMATLAATTYYLGRSHDNNILNLFPFIAVMLVCTLRMKLPEGLEGFGRAVLFGLVMWPAFFGIDAIKQGVAKAESSHIGISKVWDLAKMQSPESLKILSEFNSTPTPSVEDLAKAIHTLGQLNPRALVVINNWYVTLPDGATDVWTPMINPASYALLPKEVIRHFISQGRERFDTSGWIILQHEPQNHTRSEQEWLDLFSTSYTVGEIQTFGGYNAYLMVPK